MNINENEKKEIFILLIGGVPAIGKSFLSKKILNEFSDIYEIKYLNFDSIENINKNNYLQYQQMRTDYLNKTKEILSNINLFSKSTIIILDDNFFLKSMRKKIYNLFIDTIFDITSNNNKNNNFVFYYLEILLKPNDINFCLKLNSERKINEKIPDNIIINMNNVFEYSSPYIENDNNLVININGVEDLQKIGIKNEIFNRKEKFGIKLNNKNYNFNDNNNEENKGIKKNNKAILIDCIESIIRKDINEIFKCDKDMKKKGKNISVLKKEYMKKISNIINNIENFIEDKKNIINYDLSKEIIIKISEYLNNDSIDNNINNNNDLLFELIKNNFKDYLLINISKK